jgi:small subunit ribosomal protein S14
MAKKSAVKTERSRQGPGCQEVCREARRAQGDRQRRKSCRIEERFEARLKLAELPRNSAKIRIRNRCEVTGRPRAFYRKLKMSRIALRELGNQGQIPGLLSRAGKDDSTWR